MERKTQNQSQRNWTRRKPRPRRKNSGPAQAGDVLSALLASLGGGPERARLSLLWQNWEPVMGPELAPLALPLGRHKDILLIGAEDAMLMQELHLMSGENQAAHSRIPARARSPGQTRRPPAPAQRLFPVEDGPRFAGGSLLCAFRRKTGRPECLAEERDRLKTGSIPHFSDS